VPPSTVPPTTVPPTTVPLTGFQCPIAGATSFFDTWGAARSGGRSHKGVDMFAQRGTPVVAPVSGVVRHSSGSALAGFAFYLDGDDGNVYFGAHLDSFGASGRVGAGTVVGTVGNTGNARFSSPHLHFEIKPGGGRSVNPTSTVRAACG
jgi:murein DD-endopeptidase MepM/ murein hydrolase activator NlpD